MMHFKPGDVILYQNGGRNELGIIKRQGQADDTFFVRYHTGDTAACTQIRNMQSISNDYAFLIVRKSVESEMHLNPLKKLSNEIVDELTEAYLLNDNKSEPDLAMKIIYRILNEYK